MEQRTKEWYLARKGKITASEAYVLLSNHKEQMNDDELAAYKAANPKSKTTTKEVPFSDGTYTYLKKKVAEYYMTDEDFFEDTMAKQPFNRAIDHGNLWESDARDTFARVHNLQVEEVGFLPLVGFKDIAGGSPDGIVENENGRAIIEIKCPWNSEIHQDHCLFQTGADLQEYNLQYYVQMQFNMLVTSTEFGYFISFDPRLTMGSLKTLIVERDEEMCKTLLKRVEMAENWMEWRKGELECAMS